MQMVNKEELNKRIKDSGLKKTFLAKALGLSRQGFFNKCEGIQEFNADEINILCKLLKITKATDKVYIFLTER